jgi:hypothetical protein
MIEIIFSWQKLLQTSGLRREKLKKAEDRFRNIEELFLRFAKKASAFNSWFENAEEDLTDPVKCNSLEEIRVNLLTEKKKVHFILFLRLLSMHMIDLKPFLKKHDMISMNLKHLMIVLNHYIWLLIHIHGLQWKHFLIHGKV